MGQAKSYVGYTLQTIKEQSSQHKYQLSPIATYIRLRNISLLLCVQYSYCAVITSVEYISAHALARCTAVCWSVCNSSSSCTVAEQSLIKTCVSEHSKSANLRDKASFVLKLWLLLLTLDSKTLKILKV